MFNAFKMILAVLLIAMTGSLASADDSLTTSRLHQPLAGYNGGDDLIKDGDTRLSLWGAFTALRPRSTDGWSEGTFGTNAGASLEWNAVPWDGYDFMLGVSTNWSRRAWSQAPLDRTDLELMLTAEWDSDGSELDDNNRLGLRLRLETGANYLKWFRKRRFKVGSSERHRPETIQWLSRVTFETYWMPEGSNFGPLAKVQGQLALDDYAEVSVGGELQLGMIYISDSKDDFLDVMKLVGVYRGAFEQLYDDKVETEAKRTSAGGRLEATFDRLTFSMSAMWTAMEAYSFQNRRTHLKSETRGNNFEFELGVRVVF